MDIKEQEVLGDRIGTHWYYYSKTGAMRAYLGKRHHRHVIDIGAGSGFFLKYLLAGRSADSAPSNALTRWLACWSSVQP